MFFKHYPLAIDSTDVVVLAYFDTNDFDIFDFYGKYITHTKNLLKEVVDVIWSKIKLIHPHIYAQAIFSYPMIHRKLESATEWMKLENDPKQGHKLVNVLISKFCDDFEEEFNIMSFKEYEDYRGTYADGWLKALSNGQFLLYFANYPNEVQSPKFKTDFELPRVCIQNTGQGPKLLHKRDRIICERRDQKIENIRKDYYENKKGFHTIVY